MTVDPTGFVFPQVLPDPTLVEPPPRVRACAPSQVRAPPRSSTSTPWGRPRRSTGTPRDGLRRCSRPRSRPDRHHHRRRVRERRVGLWTRWSRSWRRLWRIRCCTRSAGRTDSTGPSCTGWSALSRLLSPGEALAAGAAVPPAFTESRPLGGPASAARTLAASHAQRARASTRSATPLAIMIVPRSRPLGRDGG
jgi:hypothetical protein